LCATVVDFQRQRDRAVPFADGIGRDVYEDFSGRQYVVNEYGERVYGVWHIAGDDLSAVPIVIDAHS
jgi:hypothetical protein